MAFVVDASVTASWLMPDEVNALAERAFDLLESEKAFVPAIWWFETRNLLITNERRKRIQHDQCDRLLALLNQIPIIADNSPNELRTIGLARKYGLTIYDAAYIELAGRLAIPLATLDDRLVNAARAEMVGLFSD